MSTGKSLIKPEIKASGKQFALIGFHNSHHSYVMPVMHDNNDIKKASYWANCTRSVKAGDFITVRKEDHSFIARLYVRAVEPNYGLKVFLIEEHDLLGKKCDSEESAKDFEISFVPAHKHRIIRKKTKDILEKGFQTREEAEVYLEKYLND